MTENQQPIEDPKKPQRKKKYESWEEWLKRMKESGALINDSGVHSDEDWEQKTISEADLSEG